MGFTTTTKCMCGDRRLDTLWFGQVLEILGDGSDRQRVNEAFAELRRRMGRRLLHFLAIQPLGKDVIALEVLSTSYSSEWLQRYQEFSLQLVDPSVRHLGVATMPFRWRDALGEEDDQRRRQGAAMLHDAARHELADGWTFPVNTRSGLVGGVGLGGPESYDWDDATVSALWGLVSVMTLRALGSAAPAPIPHVPRREREVLGHLVGGLTSPEIAESMGITPNTVNWHIGELGKRLGARNRQHLIVLAMRSGLVF